MEAEMRGSRLAGPLCVVLVLGALAAGCGGGGSDASGTTTDEADATALAEIRDDFRGFVGVPWYTAPRNLRITGSWLEAYTDWYDDYEGEQLALQLCRVLMANYVRANTAHWDLKDVT